MFLLIPKILPGENKQQTNFFLAGQGKSHPFDYNLSKIESSWQLFLKMMILQNHESIIWWSVRNTYL